MWYCSKLSLFNRVVRRVLVFGVSPLAGQLLSEAVIVRGQHATSPSCSHEALLSMNSIQPPGAVLMKPFCPETKFNPPKLLSQSLVVPGQQYYSLKQLYNYIHSICLTYPGLISWRTPSKNSSALSPHIQPNISSSVFIACD